MWTDEPAPVDSGENISNFRSIFRSGFRDIFRSQFNVTSVIQRLFINFDAVLNSYAMLGTPLVFNGDFSIDVEFATTVGNTMIVSGGNSTNGLEIYVSLDGFIFVYREGVIDVILANKDYADGKLHTLNLTRVGDSATITLDDEFSATDDVIGTCNINVIGRRLGFANWFDGVISNPAFNNNGTTTTFKLDQSTGTTENSLEANNSLTYINMPEANRELFQLSDDKTQWDNISPPVQVLPSVIEVA